jgi:hypothetical protein
MFVSDMNPRQNGSQIKLKIQMFRLAAMYRVCSAVLSVTRRGFAVTLHDWTGYRENAEIRDVDA